MTYKSCGPFVHQNTYLLKILLIRPKMTFVEFLLGKSFIPKH